MDADTAENKRCKVYNGEQLVGVLTRYPDTENTTLFEYDAEYAGPNLPFLPREGPALFSKGLHPFFCNFVSEGWLKDAQTSALIHLGKIHRFDLLCHFGAVDCLGAWRFIAAAPLPENVATLIDAVALKLAEQIDKDISGPAKLARRNSALIPGKQPKVLVAQLETGDYSLANGEPSTHIGKLPHDDPDFPGMIDVEYATMELARALLPDDKTSETQLVPVIGYKGPILLIKRFDRDLKTGKFFEMFEFNQLLGNTSDDKYEGSFREIAGYIRAHATGDHKDGIRTNLADIDILFERLLVNVILENGDAHLKNFALLRADGKNECRLAPNYDIVSCAPYNNTSTLGLAVGGHKNPKGQKDIKIRNLEARHILLLAEDMGLLSPDPTAEEVAKVSAMVHKIADRADAICEDLRTSSLTRFPNLEKIMGSQFSPNVQIISSRMNKRVKGVLEPIDFAFAKSTHMHSNAKPKRSAPAQAPCGGRPLHQIGL